MPCCHPVPENQSCRCFQRQKPPVRLDAAVKHFDVTGISERCLQQRFEMPEEHLGRGLSHRMMERITQHGDLQ
jgi:hypothetical protein